MGKEKKDAHQLSPKVCILTWSRCTDPSSGPVALVNGVGMKMDRICGRGGKTAPSRVARHLPESGARLESHVSVRSTNPCPVPRSLCPNPPLQSRRGQAQGSEQAQLPCRQGGGGGAGSRQQHQEEISQTRSCSCRQR